MQCPSLAFFSSMSATEIIKPNCEIAAMSLREISYEEILPIWQNELWLDRKDPIEPVSCMTYLEGHQENRIFEATYYGWFENDKLVGVNSGHRCLDESYRSRGLWVHEDYRGRGIAQKLLTAVIEDGRAQKATFCWSFPRQSSWKSYLRSGFEQTTEFSENLNNTNAFCIYHY